MPLQVQCPSCDSTLNAPDGLIGKTAACPKCKQPVNIAAPDPVAAPAPEPKRRSRPATEKQKAFATELGIIFDEGISAKDISAMIDAALDREERMEEGAIEPHLKTLRKCTESELIDEMGKRGYQAFMVFWEEEITGTRIMSTDGLASEQIRQALVIILYEYARQAGVEFEDAGQQLLAFLAKCARGR
ncbi:MAG: hypothetical protein IT427_00330 [Pirellulales bacterium]|nr:hypothetical protein [Pirellulales bacterium]